jgi:hypothetical protein
MAKKTSDSDKTTEPIYLTVREDRNGGYFHLTARINTQRYEAHRSSWVPYGLSDDYNGPLYSNLELRCQGDSDSRQRPADREQVYGFSCEYRDLWSVDARKAERMYKTLKTIATKLEKLVETRGYTKTFGEYCGRIAEVIGAKGFMLDRPASKYNDAGWDQYSIGDGVNRINHLIFQWVRDGQPKPVETTADASISA